MIGGVRLEILRQRGMQIIAEPRLILRALQIATGFVDFERRIPCDVGLHHSIKDFFQQVWICYAPQAAGVTEPVRLIVVVISGREILASAFDSRVRNAVPMFDAGGSELDVVPRVGFFHSGVMRHAQSNLGWPGSKRPRKSWSNGRETRPRRKVRVWKRPSRRTRINTTLAIRNRAS